MPGMPDITAGRAAVASAGTAAVTEVTVGLNRAWQAAGDTLSGIFGGRPWELSWTEIVDAVGGNAGEAAGILLGGIL